jgi:hypothetical protein
MTREQMDRRNGISQQRRRRAKIAIEVLAKLGVTI